jgi:hypothetical protein
MRLHRRPIFASQAGPRRYVTVSPSTTGAGHVYKARPVGRPGEFVALKLIEGVGDLDAQLVDGCAAALERGPCGLCKRARPT